MLSREIITSALEIASFDAVAAQKKMSPNPGTFTRNPAWQGTASAGAVTVICYEKKRRMHLLLIKRQDHLQYHPGQVSFPGGRCETGETFFQAALRETEEEVGIPPAGLTLLGRLKPVYISVSDFCVHPFVMWHNGPPAVVPDKGEVASVLEVPLDSLFDKYINGEPQRRSGNHTVKVPCFEIGRHRVWGATAMILSEMFERLRKVLGK